MPKVSVIIPSYNCVKYITEAVESVMSQTLKDYEIVVVNDGSSDNTMEVLRPYIEAEKIRYYYQENRGLSAARNRGISEARGEYVVFLDCDDLWLPQMLEKSLQLSETYDYDIVVTDWYRVVIDDGGEVSREMRIRNFFDNPEKFLKALHLKFQGTYCTFQKKSIFEEVGRFDENLFFGEDVDMWIRFAKHGLKVGVVHEPLFIYRKREGSLTAHSTPKNLVSRYKFIRKYQDMIVADDELRKIYSQKLWNIARESFYLKGDMTDRWSLVSKCVTKSLSFDNSLLRVLRSFSTVFKNIWQK